MGQMYLDSFLNRCELKGTSRGLSGMFQPLVIYPLCRLKYFDEVAILASFV